MHAIEISRPGGPEVLAPVELPDPVAGPGEVLIEVQAAGVNRPDILQRKGLYPPPAGASAVPGLEVAGRIVGGELAGTGWRLGDAVCALLSGGGYAERCVVPAGQCLPVPAGLSFIEAAAVPETAFTVWSNVFDRAALAPGETLLVQGGASGIGVMAIQIAAARGHTVFATAGTDAKCRACEDLGATRAVNYRHTALWDELRAAAGPHGVNVILDMVAGSYVRPELELLAPDGRLVIIATLGGAQAAIDAGLLLRKRLVVTGSTLRARDAGFKAAIATRLRVEVWPLIEAGRVRCVVHAVFPLTEAALAHQALEGGEHVGKIVLAVGPQAHQRPARPAV
jgi:NADPH2:quinone reductase